MPFRHNLHIAFFLITFCVLIIASCDSPEPQDKEDVNIQVNKLFHKQRSLEYIEEDCDTAISSCVTYRATFPEFYLHEESYKGTPSNPLTLEGNVAITINGDIMELLSSTDSLTGQSSPKARFENLFRQYLADLSDNNYGIPAYSVNTDINILTNKYGILSLKILEYSYWGGAHGMYGYSFQNYDLYKNEKIDFKDVFERKNLSTQTIKNKLTDLALEVLADTARINLGNSLTLGDTEVLKMSDKEILSKAGYWVDDFEIKENFGITRKGVLFIYQPYEISSYARGAVSVFLPFDDIKPYLKEGSPIRRMFVDEITR